MSIMIGAKNISTFKNKDEPYGLQRRFLTNEWGFFQQIEIERGTISIFQIYKIQLEAGDTCQTLHVKRGFEYNHATGLRTKIKNSIQYDNRKGKFRVQSIIIQISNYKQDIDI